MSDEEGQTSSPVPPPDNSNASFDRNTLVEKARTFLLSPTVRHENETAKRSFLEEKGLTNEEIDGVIRELPPQPPPVPPRTYPPPPPSNLPLLLVSLFRAFTWVAGLSGALLIGYYGFLLPRLTRSLAARHKLKLHQSDLLEQLRGRINDLKTAQEEAYNELSLQGHKSFPLDNKGLSELPANPAGEPIHPLGVVIRCAFSGEDNQRLTLEEIYHRLLAPFPGIKNQDEREYKHLILRELTRSTSFDGIKEGEVVYWSLCQDAASSSIPASAPPISSTLPLENLRDAASRGSRPTNSFQHTFKSLTDLTAFLSHETYALYGATTSFRSGLLSGQPLGPAEEDVRRDIRALKGLVLNRRTFAPSPHRTPSTAAAASAS